MTESLKTNPQDVSIDQNTGQFSRNISQLPIILILIIKSLILNIKTTGSKAPQNKTDPEEKIVEEDNLDFNHPEISIEEWCTTHDNQEPHCQTNRKPLSLKPGTYHYTIFQH